MRIQDTPPPATTLRPREPRAARPRRLCLRTILSVLLVLALGAAARASDDECQVDEVQIGFQGKMCAWQNFAVTLNGAVANGPGTECMSFAQFPTFTNKAWTKLKIDQTYELRAESALCISNINFDVPEGYVLYVDGVERQTLTKTNGGQIYSGDGTWQVVVRRACPCGTPACGESPGARRGSVVWEVGLGRLSDGRSAESISIREKSLTPHAYTPAALVYTPPGQTSEVDVVRDSGGRLRQVRAPQLLADVVTLGGSEFDIRYYRPADVGAKSGGLYAVTGQPYVTWKIKNPDPASTGKLQILKIENGATTDKSEYSWDAAVDAWTLKTGWDEGAGTYARTETSTVSFPTQTSRTETAVVRAAGGQLVSKVAKTYQAFPWGEELVQRVVDPDAAALTTTYAYYENPAEERRYRKLQSVTHPDGSWVKYDYDEHWNKNLELRPWKDLALAAATETNSRATYFQYAEHDGYQLYYYNRFLSGVEEHVEGRAVSARSIARWSASGGQPIKVGGQQVVIEEESAYASSSAQLKTRTTRFHSSAAPFYAGRVASIEHPDGRRDTFTYEKGNYAADALDPSLSQFTPDAAAGRAERVTTVHGTTAAPDGVAFKTTKETSVRDQFGNEVLQETYVYNGSAYERVGWTVMDYDDRGHLTQTRRHNGQVVSATWSGERKTSDVDASGTETTYTYDALGRLKTQTKKGVAAGGTYPAQPDVVTTFDYDAEGRQTGVTAAAGGLSLSKSSAYDVAGRIRSEIDHAGLVTLYTYANGGRTETATLPGGATRVTDNYLDGQRRSETGTAVVAKAFDYGVNPDGTQYTLAYTGGGLNSPRWERTTKDFLGRTIRVERPGFGGTTLVETFAYNAKGQLQSESSAAGAVKLLADKLYEYDELGRRARSGLDVNGDGLLTLPSTDRVADAATRFEQSGGDWFAVNTASTYEVNNSDAPTTQSQRERLNNFPAAGAEKTFAEVSLTDVGGNVTVNSSAVNRAAKKVTHTSDTPDSNVSEVGVRVNGLLQSSSTATPEAATTYAYDALGRQTGATHPKGGTTTQTYSPATGQLISEADAVAATTYEYYPAAHANAGRLKSRADAAGKKVYFRYDGRGALVQTWGDAAHPLEYVYDAYGQQTELRTYRGGQNWGAASWPAAATGAADVTRWVYHAPTGLLEKKIDAANKETVYTYDPLGRTLTRAWARAGGAVTTYSYHPQTGEQTGVDYSDTTPDVSYGYDRAGRRSSITDAAGAHTRTYNAKGDLLTDRVAGGPLDLVQVSTSYDPLLRRQFLQTSRGAAVLTSQTYTYDAASRPETTVSGGQTVTYAYHPTKGALTNTSFTGGTNVGRGYDALGRLETISLSTAAAGTLASYAYEYNNLHQRTRVTREDGSYWSYSYNDRGELTAGRKYWPDNTAVWGRQSEYEYDSIGNRKAARAGGNESAQTRRADYAANSLNQYTQRANPGAADVTGTAHAAATVTVNGQPTARRGDYFYKELAVDNGAAPAYAQVSVVGARQNFGAGGEDAVSQRGGRAFVPRAAESYAYDADGNTASDGRWSFAWDGEQRLAAMEALPSVPAEAKLRLEFAYDWMGRRIQKKVYAWDAPTSSYQPQSVTKFVYDGWNLVAELDGAGALLRGYAWGSGGLLLIRDGANTYHVGPDGQMNVTHLVDAAAGTLSASYEYDPFGIPLTSVGGYAAQNPFKFGGKYADAETGLSYYGHRYYDPQTGRWLSRDPSGEEGGVNLYAFVANDPLTKVDQLGLFPIRVVFDAFIPQRLNPPDGWYNEPGTVYGEQFRGNDRAEGQFNEHGEEGYANAKLFSVAEVESTKIGQFKKWGVARADSNAGRTTKRSYWNPWGDWKIKQRQSKVVNGDGQLDDIGPCRSTIRFQPSSGYPFALTGKYIFTIDYTAIFSFRIKYGNPRYIDVELQGGHNGFPDYEAYVNNNLFYHYATPDKGPGMWNLGVKWLTFKDKKFEIVAR